MSGEPLPENIKQEIRSVLLTSTDGVAVNKFMQDYERLTFTKLNTLNYGYSNILKLLQSIPDVVRYVTNRLYMEG